MIFNNDKKNFHDVDIFLELMCFTFYTFQKKISLNTHNCVHLTHSGTQALFVGAEKYHIYYILYVVYVKVQFWIDVRAVFG